MLSETSAKMTLVVDKVEVETIRGPHGGINAMGVKLEGVNTSDFVAHLSEDEIEAMLEPLDDDFLIAFMKRRGFVVSTAGDTEC